MVLSKFAAISAIYWAIKSRRQKFKNLPAHGILLTHFTQKEQNESQEILKNQLIQKAQQYFTNIASIFELSEILNPVRK